MIYVIHFCYRLIILYLYCESDNISCYRSCYVNIQWSIEIEKKIIVPKGYLVWFDILAISIKVRLEAKRDLKNLRRETRYGPWVIKMLLTPYVKK